MQLVKYVRFQSRILNTLLLCTYLTAFLVCDSIIAHSLYYVALWCCYVAWRVVVLLFGTASCGVAIWHGELWCCYLVWQFERVQFCETARMAAGFGIFIYFCFVALLFLI